VTAADTLTRKQSKPSRFALSRCCLPCQAASLACVPRLRPSTASLTLVDQRYVAPCPFRACQQLERAEGRCRACFVSAFHRHNPHFCYLFVAEDPVEALLRSK
jgi:hypothetical protein